MLKWSDNVMGDLPPQRLAPEEPGTHRDRAWPYADTPYTDEPRYILVTPKAVTFRGQRGPIKDVGVNGCQVDDILTFALGCLQSFNKKHPCRQNSIAITKLEESLHWLDDRRREREARGVEGRDKA